MNHKTYIERRRQLFEQLPHQSFSLFFSGKPLRKTQDADYPFFANRNFFYLTGIEEQEAILLLVKTAHEHREFLFVRNVEADMEKWVGHYIRPLEATDISGISTVMFLSDFDAFFHRHLKHFNIQTIGLDNDASGFDARSLEADDFAVYANKRLSGYPLFNTYPMVCDLRTRKTPEEVEAIRYACRNTHEAIEEMLEELKPQANERDLSSRFHYAVERKGGRPTFDTICASGANSCVLHYISNNQIIEDNALVLLDLGGCYEGYGADISQTYPSNGTFTPRQREVYEVVLDCFHQITEATRPGVTMGDLNALANRVLGEGCVRLGLIQDKSEFRKYYFHSIGHSLGLDTHDVGFNEETVLMPGHVITNEPGLYIAQEKIGIRIETDLLVTAHGCEDLAPWIKREVHEVEALVQAKQKGN